MTNYYVKSLNASNLKNCYQLATPRILQYLDAEVEYVLSQIGENQTVLELGCGYGRILKKLYDKSQNIFGIDNSLDNLLYAQKYLSGIMYNLVCMNAVSTGFSNNSFDIVLCLQNGISAFHVDPKALLKETLRICKPGGIVLYSTYSDKIWDERLKWFEIQSQKNLLGKIDYTKTKNGYIVCLDGFSATTYTKDHFIELMGNYTYSYDIFEIDNSSLFCKITKNH